MNLTLSELQDTYSRFTGQDWEKFSSDIQTTGFRYSGLEVEPVYEIESTSTDSETIQVPIKLRGQVLGHLNVKPKSPDQQWGEDESILVQAAADRVALALENARLLHNAQKSAAKEHKIGEITNKISLSTNLDNILLTAIVELGQAISDSEVIIQFEDHE
jgi:hypothetical protein